MSLTALTALAAIGLITLFVTALFLILYGSARAAIWFVNWLMYG